MTNANSAPFLFIKNSSSSDLLIVFSHREARGFAGYKIAQLTRMNILYLKDQGREKLGCSWYNDVIPGLSRDADDLLKFISKIISENGIVAIYTIGSSMGGYAALLFGALLNAAASIAFVPQVVLDGKLPRNPSVDLHEIKYNKLMPILQNRSTKFLVYVGADDIIDVYNASLIKDISNVEVFFIANMGHLLLNDLNSIDGLAAKLFLESVEKKTKPAWLNTISFESINHSNIKNLESAVYSFFHHGDEKSALVEIDVLISACPLWSALWHWKGLFHYKLKDFANGIVACRNAIKLGHSSKMNYVTMGRANFALGEFEDCIECYLSAYGEEKFRAEAKLRIGVSYFSLGRFQQAISWLSQVVEFVVDYEPKYYVGMSYLKIGEKNLAKYWLAESLKHEIKDNYIVDQINNEMLTI